MRMSHLKVGSAADIPINISETDLSLLTATVVPPSGREEPCLLKRLRNGHVGKRSRGSKSFCERGKARCGDCP
jgi:filamin